MYKRYVLIHLWDKIPAISSSKWLAIQWSRSKPWYTNQRIYSSTQPQSIISNYISNLFGLYSSYISKIYMGVSKSRGTPKWMVYTVIMENPVKIDDFGAPIFLETPIYFYLISDPSSHPTAPTKSPFNFSGFWWWWIPWYHGKKSEKIQEYGWMEDMEEKDQVSSLKRPNLAPKNWLGEQQKLIIYSYPFKAFKANFQGYFNDGLL